MRRTLAVTLALLSLPAATFPCTCFGPEHEAAIRSAELIFAMHVNSTDVDQIKHVRRYQASVLAVWKGDLPESTTTYTDGSNCSFPFEIGQDYLVYMGKGYAPRMQVFLCSGTGQLESLYYDRYLLGEPVIRYDDILETVTLDTMLDRIRQDDADAGTVAYQFSYFAIEAPRLVPTLRRVARADIPGNQLAAVMALGSLGAAASEAYDDLQRVYESWGRKDSRLRAEALRAMLAINRDYPTVRWDVQRALKDDDATVRLVVATNLQQLKNKGGHALEIREGVMQGLNDADPRVRGATIRGLRFVDFSARTARIVKKLSVSDPDDEVRDSARDYLDARERYSQSARPNRTVRERGLPHKEFGKR